MLKSFEKLSKLNGQHRWVGVSRTRFSVSIEVKFRDDFSSKGVSKTSVIHVAATLGLSCVEKLPKTRLPVAINKPDKPFTVFANVLLLLFHPAAIILHRFRVTMNESPRSQDPSLLFRKLICPRQWIESF